MWNRLTEIGALYPGVGWEASLVVATVAVCLAWTIWQIRHENANFEKQRKHLHDDDTTNQEIDA